MARGICEVCKGNINPKKKTEHFKRYHPEYRFKRLSKTSPAGTRYCSYICLICKAIPGDFKALVRHYELHHKEELQADIHGIIDKPVFDLYKQPEKKPETIADVISALNDLVKLTTEERDTLRIECPDLKGTIVGLRHEIQEINYKYGHLLNQATDTEAALLEAQRLLYASK